MNCHHDGNQQQTEFIEHGCIHCWKERAEKAEAACAEMRAYIELPVVCVKDNEIVAKKLLKAELLSNPNCGQGWLSPDKAKALEADKSMLLNRVQTLTGQNEELRSYAIADATCPCCDAADECVEGCTFKTDCPTEWERTVRSRAALAAAKGEQQ